MPAADSAESGLRVAIVAVWVEGVRRRNPGAIVNAAFALAGTYLPSAARRRSGATLRPWQRLYVETAMLTHAVGMLGPYDDVWWWDHLTHAHSASILGGVVHVVARRRGRDPRPRVLGVVLAAGVVWELAEWLIHAVSRRVGLEPVLVTYGRTDTLLDLGFDLLGALAVVAFGDRLVGNLVDPDGEGAEADPTDRPRGRRDDR